MFKFLNCEARMVSKWVVGILLESFLFIFFAKILFISSLKAAGDFFLRFLDKGRN